MYRLLKARSRCRPALVIATILFAFVLVSCGSEDSADEPGSTQVPTSVSTPAPTQVPTEKPKKDEGNKVIRTIRSAPGNALDLVQEGTGWVWNQVSRGGVFIWDGIRSASSAVWDKVTGLPGDAWGQIKRFWRWLGIGRIASSVMDQVDVVMEQASKLNPAGFLTSVQNFLVTLAKLIAIVGVIALAIFAILRFALWRRAFKTVRRVNSYRKSRSQANRMKTLTERVAEVERETEMTSAEMPSDSNYRRKKPKIEVDVRVDYDDGEPS